MKSSLFWQQIWGLTCSLQPHWDTRGIRNERSNVNCTTSPDLFLHTHPQEPATHKKAVTDEKRGPLALFQRNVFRTMMIKLELRKTINIQIKYLFQATMRVTSLILFKLHFLKKWQPRMFLLPIKMCPKQKMYQQCSSIKSILVSKYLWSLKSQRR